MNVFHVHCDAAGMHGRKTKYLALACFKFEYNKTNHAAAGPVVKV